MYTKCLGVLLANGGHPRDWEDYGALKNAAANTSAPSNPREAGVAEFRAMFAQALAANHEAAI